MDKVIPIPPDFMYALPENIGNTRFLQLRNAVNQRRRRDIFHNADQWILVCHVFFKDAFEHREQPHKVSGIQIACSPAHVFSSHRF